MHLWIRDVTLLFCTAPTNPWGVSCLGQIGQVKSADCLGSSDYSRLTDDGLSNGSISIYCDSTAACEFLIRGWIGTVRCLTASSKFRLIRRNHSSQTKPVSATGLRRRHLYIPKPASLELVGRWGKKLLKKFAKWKPWDILSVRILSGLEPASNHQNSVLKFSTAVSISAGTIANAWNVIFNV